MEKQTQACLTCHVNRAVWKRFCWPSPHRLNALYGIWLNRFNDLDLQLMTVDRRWQTTKPAFPKTFTTTVGSGERKATKGHLILLNTNIEREKNIWSLCIVMQISMPKQQRGATELHSRLYSIFFCLPPFRRKTYCFPGRLSVCPPFRK